MKIGVLRRQNWRKTGIETFEKNVVPYLLEEESIDEIEFSISDSYPFSVTLGRLKLGKKIKIAIEQQDFDRVFIPSQDLMTLNPEKVDAEIIPYVHDILPATTTFSGPIQSILAKHYTRNISKSNRLICASKQTQRDIENRTSFSGKSKVVYQGVEGVRSLNKDKKYDLIYVGSLIERKFPSFLKETLEKAEAAGFRCIAVNYEQIDVPCEVKVDVSDENLVELLAQSKFYFHPSKIEGFGRGPIEAQAVGTPVIARNTPINNEVLGEKGTTWFEADRAEDVVDLLSKEVTQEAELKENANKYTWDNARASIKEVLLE